MKFYLVGIKGSGMSALACYLYDLGNIVIGSDYNETFDFERGLIVKFFNVNSTLQSSIFQFG